MSPGETTRTRSKYAAAEAGNLDVPLLIIAGLIFFAVNVDFRLVGNASMYADYAVLGKFDELTLHIGYYALIAAVDRTLGPLLHMPIQESMVWINVVAGALALAVAYRLALHFLANRREAILCAVILAVCGRITASATSSEIYMVQTLLVLSAFLLFAQERVLFAGVAAGLSLLISPLSAFTFFFFPVFDFQRHGVIRWRTLLILIAGALIVYLPYLIRFAPELLWGRRGLLGINGYARLDPRAMLTNFPRFQFKHYTLLLVLVIPAIVAARKNVAFLIVTAAAVLPSLYIILKLTSEDNVFLLNTDFFFACWLVLGWRQLSGNAVGRWVGPTALAGHVALLVASGSLFQFESHRDYADRMQSIATQYLINDDAVFISDWATITSMTYFGRPRVVSTIEHEPLFKKMYDIDAFPRDSVLLASAANIYLLDSWEPSPLNRLLSSKATMEEHRISHGLLSRVEHELKLSCSAMSREIYTLYRCVRRQAATPTA